MSIHIAKLLEKTCISMLNGTFQSIFQHVTYVTTHTYLIIETYSFTALPPPPTKKKKKKKVDVRNLCKMHLFL